MKGKLKRYLLKVLAFIVIFSIVSYNFRLTNVEAGSIPDSLFHNTAPSSAYELKNSTGYFVAGTFNEAKAYLESLGDTWAGYDYIWYETQTQECFHYYQYNIPGVVVRPGEIYTVYNCINGANNPSPSTFTFTVPSQSYATEGGPYAQITPYDKVSHQLWYYWYFTIEAVAYNSIDNRYEPTICTVLGYDQGRTMKGGLLNGWRNTGGFDNNNQYNWGSTTGYHGQTIDWRVSPLGGYGLHGGNLCGDGCGNTPLRFGDGSACLADGYKHTTTMYRFHGYKLNCVKITEDKKGGTSGTDAFYEYKGVSFNSSIDRSSVITSISVPTRTGYTFEGYYSKNTGSNGTSLSSDSVLIVDKNGNIKVGNSYFSSNTTIYALWKPISYEVQYLKGVTNN